LYGCYERIALFNGGRMDSYYCGFPLGKELWGKKYKDENDFTILDTWKRVAKAVASVENPEDRQKWYDAFLDILVTGKFIPGGRITAGAGTKHNYLLNCCVIGVKDSLAEIYESVKKAAILAKSNYGVGMNFSKLRPKNAGLTSGGIATGPVSFMKVFDASGSVIQTGGGRRAAQIAVLNISHPDIEEFIDAKHQEGVLTQFNISVGISYAFLDAVEKNESWDLYFNGKVYKTVRAKDLWEKLCKSGYLFNDPGFLFIDEVNKWSNSLYLYEMDCVNPCLHPDSMIETVHGRVKIKDITEPIMVYTCMPDGSLGIKMASASWISKRNAETLVIETANGKKVRCTPDHRILTQDMEWKEAKDLKLGDRVVQLNRRRRGVAYSGVKLTTESVESMRMEHRFIADGVWGISDSDDVHHIDGDTYNNDIDNLEILSHSDHSKYTAINDNPQSHQVVDSLGRFISTGISKKTVIPMPEDLRSNMKHGWSNSIVSISAGEITDVYDITVEDTHNLIADFTVVHNCGEITLPEDGVCCLGNINMTKFVKQPFATTGYTHIYDDTWNFDLHSYYETIDVAVRFLDNVLTLSEYPYPEMKYRAQSERRIGLNPISGLGSTLAMLCLPYDSKDALDFTEHICKEAMNASYMTSSNLAIEKGSFEKYHSDFCKGLFVRTLDDDVRNHIYKHGIRNIALLTVPPVGTGSLIAGNISNGLEPIFSLEYTRKVRQDDGSLKEECVDDYAWRMWKQK
jgi:ribonucleotide reductase alpha subunit